MIKWIKDLFKSTRVKELEQHIVVLERELLKRVLPSSDSIKVIIQDTHAESNQCKAYIQHEKLGLAPVSTFGDGIRRLLHIALKLASVKGGILLIDELESTIHTEALQNSFRWLVKWCTEMDVQS